MARGLPPFQGSAPRVGLFPACDPRLSAIEVNDVRSTLRSPSPGTDTSPW